jgi:hypothetical protein
MLRPLNRPARARTVEVLAPAAAGCRLLRPAPYRVVPVVARTDRAFARDVHLRHDRVVALEGDRRARFITARRRRILPGPETAVKPGG